MKFETTEEQKAKLRAIMRMQDEAEKRGNGNNFFDILELFSHEDPNEKTTQDDHQQGKSE